jgi:hypothetical protein
MARDDDDDLYDEEFDFVDDDYGDGEEDDGPRGEVEEEPNARERGAIDRREAEDDRGREDVRGEDEEPVDEYGRPEPKPDYVVHVYEYQKFKRTIDRPFTAEDAEAFASEYNRTSKPYGRFAVAGKNDAKPKKTLD